ncbi:hypothetical protein MBLNU230_g5236t1 [Neophaeotheca triangularis]
MVFGKSAGIHPDQQTRGSDDAKPDHRDHHDFADKLREKMKDTHLYDVKIKATHLKNRLGKFKNLVNPNHRHDEEHEQATDAKRTRIAEAHRFQSFAPERAGNRIKWYIDGRDYFWAVSVALENAKESIYIEDWWLSPELFLRRPPFFELDWRLDKTLKRAAERGVKIYVVVYKEVAQALSCNSAHTKHALEALCPEGTPGHGNIAIMRHPDHNVFENAGDMTFYWAHHEKFIVIDYNMAFIGGLDLCFGRWDDRQHPLADAHPAGVQNEVFPGQDFNNNRIMDFQSVEDWKSNELSKAEYGRMPWHDVAMGVIGPCVYDIAEHFVLRWNFCKRDKYKRDERYDWLTMTGRTGEDEDLIGVQRPKHPVGEYVHHPFSDLSQKTGDPNQAGAGHKNLGKDTGGAVDGLNVPEDAPEYGGSDDDEFHDAEENVDARGYTEEQHRRGHGFQKEMRSRGIHRPHLHTDPEEKKKKEREAKTPNVPLPEKQENAHHTGQNTGEEGMVSASGGLAEKQAEYESNKITDEGDSEGGQGTVHGQLVRSSADWSSGILTEQSIQNAYCQIIRSAKHLVYIENQFFITATGDQQAPVHNQIGRAIVDAICKADQEGRKFRVIIIIPAIPGFAGDLRSDAAAGTRAMMDYQYKSINRGEHSIFGQCEKQGVDASKYFFAFNLRSYDRINNTPAMKKMQEESGVSYQEVQRAEAEEVMGSGMHGVGGESSSEDNADSESDAEDERSNLRSRKKKFESKRKEAGLEGDIDTEVMSKDSIAEDAMLGTKKVSEENYAGREPGKGEGDPEENRQQEVENFVHEELYIHGKLLIVDDRIVICGSSNINDRSQLGFHDSELSIVMEDTLPLQSTMNGAPYTAGHHAATLRRMMWREHLGLLPPQELDGSKDPNAQPPSDGDNIWYEGDEHDKFVEDPLSDDVWEMWTKQATTNTSVFRHLFHADPDDNVKTFDDYDKFLPKSQKAGHVYDPFQPVDHLREELDKIKGHLVWMPLDFLKDETMAETGLQVNNITESIYT